MIDGVELVLVDQPLEMRELERDHAVRRQQMRHAADEIIEVRHLRQNVVADDEVGLLAFGGEPLRERQPEKLDQRRNILAPRHLGHVGGGLDPDDRHAERQEVLKQISVVAGDLIHPAVGAEVEPRLDHLAVAPRVLDPGCRIRGEVGVLGEDVLRLHVLLQLHQEASVAHQRVQRIVGSIALISSAVRKALAKRRHSEVDEGRRERPAANPATARARTSA